jgi:membrane protein DedA with SNARE-associated domain
MQFVVGVSRLVLHAFYHHNFSVVFVLVLIEEAGIPIPVPGDTLVMLAGARPHKTFSYDIAMLLLSSLAVFIGSSILYFFMRYKGRPFLDRYGKYLHLSQRRLGMLERWFARHGRIAIIFGRLIPGLRIPTTVMAGLSDVPYSVYAPTAAIAAVVWSMIYFWAGVFIAAEWRIITGLTTGILDDFSESVIWIWLLVILFLGGGTLHFGRRAWRSKRAQRATRLMGSRVAAEGTQPAPQPRPDARTELS